MWHLWPFKVGMVPVFFKKIWDFLFPMEKTRKTKRSRRENNNNWIKLPFPSFYSGFTRREYNTNSHYCFFPSFFAVSRRAGFQHKLLFSCKLVGPPQPYQFLKRKTRREFTTNLILCYLPSCSEKAARGENNINWISWRLPQGKMIATGGKTTLIHKKPI